MKYEIKWPWAGAEQTAIVESLSESKPVAVLYFYDDNNKVHKNNYIVLQEGYSIGGGGFAQAIGLNSCRAINTNWIIEVGHDGYQLLYNDIVMLEWNDYDETAVFYGRQRLADWFTQEQPELREWQVEKAVKSYQALNYLKASIEHEQD
jgi:hypothetical protein